MPENKSPAHADSSKLVIKGCAYCLENAVIKDYQVLVRGASFYLCAPRGQLAEGYLAIAPYQCIGSLSQVPVQSFSELTQLKRAVKDFYRSAYQVTQATFYEQGRAGGGAAIDEAGGFPLHAHLCSLPTPMDLHTVLTHKYVRRDLSGLHELPGATRSEPYVYVEGLDASGAYRRSAYVAHSHQTRTELGQMRLKPTIAGLMGLPGRGDWRAYPGDRELQQVIMKFSVHQAAHRPDCSRTLPPSAEGRTESVMTELIEKVQHLMSVARANEDAGDTTTAAEVLRQSIDTLERALARSEGDMGCPAAEVEDVGAREIAVQLADVYGTLGGILRKQGNYLASAAAYDHGFHLESDPSFAMRNTYNALNRLITRILLSPDCLADPDLLRGEQEIEFVDVRHQLAELCTLLQEQIAGVRAADFWAAGDLSLACALTGDEPGMNRALEKFGQLSPPPTAYDAYRNSIKALAQLDTPRKAVLLKARAAWSQR